MHCGEATNQHSLAAIYINSREVVGGPHRRQTHYYAVFVLLLITISQDSFMSAKMESKAIWGCILQQLFTTTVNCKNYSLVYICANPTVTECTWWILVVVMRSVVLLDLIYIA